MSNVYVNMSKEELKTEYDNLKVKYTELQEKKYNLDMSRGKPCKEQLDLSNEILTADYGYIINNVDCRNYGGLDGISEMKKIFADILDLESENIIVGGNSSLNMMYDLMSTYYYKGVCGHEPWAKQEKIKFLCPSPGYDRHFSICEFLGIEMITVPIYNTGPDPIYKTGIDISMIEKLVAEDESIKGIWCVPKYSNPEGTVYSDEVVRRFANLKPKAKDFRIFWDDAYTLHHLDEEINILNILRECEKANNPDLPVIFASFSKISLAGNAVSCVASSLNNLQDIKKRLFVQTVGPNKIDQLKHVKFFKDLPTIKNHMKKHRDILKPKFDLVLEEFKKELGETGYFYWTEPKGGYFISFYSAKTGCAKKIVQLCKEAGVVLTDAGATFPYKKDPQDNNIRIAPSYPSLEELKKALEVLCVSAKLVVLEKLI